MLANEWRGYEDIGKGPRTGPVPTPPPSKSRDRPMTEGESRGSWASAVERAPAIDPVNARIRALAARRSPSIVSRCAAARSPFDIAL